MSDAQPRRPNGESEPLPQRDDDQDRQTLLNPDTWREAESNQNLTSAEVGNNIMLHGYRQLAEPQQMALRNLKDLALNLWNELHVIDGSSAGRPEFNSRELETAAVRLEEAMLWAEKHFNL